MKIISRDWVPDGIVFISNPDIEPFLSFGNTKPEMTIDAVDRGDGTFGFKASYGPMPEIRFNPEFLKKSIIMRFEDDN